MDVVTESPPISPPVVIVDSGQQQQQVATTDPLVVLTLFLAVVATCQWLFKGRRNSRAAKLAALLPGPAGWPLIGNAIDFMGSNNSIFETIVAHGKVYKDVGRLWIGNRLVVFLVNPADIELILSSDQHIDKSIEYDYLRPWLGNGLLVSTGDKWRSHRRIIAPTFHLSVLKQFMGRFNQNARAAVERLKGESGKMFDVHDHMSELTVETLISTVMGVRTDTKDRAYYDYAMAVMKLCDVIHSRQTKVWLMPDFTFYLTKYWGKQKRLLSVIHGLTKNVLNKKLDDMETRVQGVDTAEANEETFSEKDTTSAFSYGQASGLKDDIDNDEIGEKKRAAFLESIIERANKGDSINDREVKEQLDTIMFEGHDTTAAASSFFLCIMAAHQDVQAKCYEELTKIFGQSDRDVTFQDTLEMKYLERCLMETLRLYPPVPVVARQIKSELKLASSNLTIPANCTVIVGTYKLHRRDDIYPNPDVFDPDRFLPEVASGRHFYSFIPFSAGPRSCVGRKYAMLKLKTILATVLRNFQIMPGDDELKWKLQADIILKRSDGFNISLKPRKV